MSLKNQGISLSPPAQTHTVISSGQPQQQAGISSEDFLVNKVIIDYAELGFKTYLHQRRQEELERKALELERREEELRNRQLEINGKELKIRVLFDKIITTYILIFEVTEHKNWPPLPKKFCVEPCFYQDINLEIGVEFQNIVHRLYYVWLRKQSFF